MSNFNENVWSFLQGVRDSSYDAYAKPAPIKAGVFMNADGVPVQGTQDIQNQQQAFMNGVLPQGNATVPNNFMQPVQPVAADFGAPYRYPDGSSQAENGFMGDTLYRPYKNQPLTDVMNGQGNAYGSAPAVQAAPQSSPMNFGNTAVAFDESLAGAPRLPFEGGMASPVAPVAQAQVPQAGMSNNDFRQTMGITTPELDLGVNQDIMNMDLGNTGGANADGFFSDVTGKDAIGFGFGAAQTALGAYLQDRRLKIYEGQLDLSRDKFNQAKADKQLVRDSVTESRAKKAASI